jgi:hypothetical protein
MPVKVSLMNVFKFQGTMNKKRETDIPADGPSGFRRMLFCCFEDVRFPSYNVCLIY